MPTKSFALALLGVFIGCALLPGVVMAARTVGSTIADASGIGEICFAVNPSTDPDQFASAIAKDLELQHGPGVEGGFAAPEIESVTVENGEAIVTYRNAQPNAQVIGIIPDDDSATAAALLFRWRGLWYRKRPLCCRRSLGGRRRSPRRAYRRR